PPDRGLGRHPGSAGHRAGRSRGRERPGPGAGRGGMRPVELAARARLARQGRVGRIAGPVRAAVRVSRVALAVRSTPGLIESVAAIPQPPVSPIRNAVLTLYRDGANYVPAYDQGGGADPRLRVSHRIVEQRRLQRHLPGHEAPEEDPERADQSEYGSCGSGTAAASSAPSTFMLRSHSSCWEPSREYPLVSARWGKDRA